MPREDDYSEPAPKQTNWALWLGCGAVVLLVLGCGVPLLLCGGLGIFGMNEIAKQDKRVNDEPGTPLTALELSQAFKDDAEAANAKYDDKVLLVTGVIAKKPSDDEMELAAVNGGSTIKCDASVNKADLFKFVQVGDTVQVKGLCTGIAAGEINLESCQSVQKTKKTK
jgi:hypothetical protein